MRYLLVFLLGSIFMQAQTLNLNIKVGGISETKGKLMYRIRNAKGVEITKGVQTVENKTETISLQLAAGKYAIALFHDANDNDELDRGFTGIPTELYGFSNNARGMFGPPDLEDQLISLETNKTIKVLIE